MNKLDKSKRSNILRHQPRTIILGVIFLLLFSVLISRLFSLQIIQGEDYSDAFALKTKKTRILESTRGNIYDRNGNLLASNQLVYSVTLEDNGTYETIRDKQLALNSISYKLVRILEEYQGTLSRELAIAIDDNGNYVFNKEGIALDRFRADIYGKSNISEMTPMQADATAETIMTYLSSQDKFALYEENDIAYSEEELTKNGLPSGYTNQEILSIMNIRYLLSLNTYQRYIPITVATDISDETIANMVESKEELQGVDIAEGTIRVYEEGDWFAHILGYTGKISTEELQTGNQNYTRSSVIGKTGIEQYMDSTLQGVDGSEEVYVNNVGKVVGNADMGTAPTSGKDVYLTLDKELQEAAYKILEQRIAGILVANISNIKEFDKSKVTDVSTIVIPITDVYCALIDNNIIAIQHFQDKDATDMEKNTYSKFQEKQASVLEMLSNELKNSGMPYKDLNAEMQTYIDYVVEFLKDQMGVLSSDKIDKEDETYLAWTKEGSISLRDFISYALSKNWINISNLPSDAGYMDSEQTLDLLISEITSQLQFDKEFSKEIYKYMIHQESIPGYEICQLLYEQGVLSTEDSEYDKLLNRQISAYEFIITKIQNLEITPAQLALDPCAGSAVVTDPQTGEVLACVTYPGYDNNRLANQIDAAYYSQLNTDLSYPFYNRATQELTAPGSTFKPVTVAAGLMEGVITSDTHILCDGVFDKVVPNLKCWNRAGHGLITSPSDAIKNSCNDYLCEIVYRLGSDIDEVYSEDAAIDKLQEYAKLFDLDKNSGVELAESQPQITDQYAIPSSIGQGTHNYSTVQLARYVTSLANTGNSYHLSLLDKVADHDGNTIEEYSPQIQSQIDLPTSVWNDIQSGMEQAAESNSILSTLSINVAGKTGTAEETNAPSHGLFIGYAPADDPKITVAVRIANGYTAANAVGVASDIINYHFELKAEDTIITGRSVKAAGNTHTD